MKVVLHTSFGGFHLTDEMCLWLHQERGWSLGKFHCSIGGNINYLVDHNRMGNIDFRGDKDLVDCVESIQKNHKHETYSSRYYCYECGHLEIIDYNPPKPYIVDYHDGKERIEHE